MQWLLVTSLGRGEELAPAGSGGANAVRDTHEHYKFGLLKLLLPSYLQTFFAGGWWRCESVRGHCESPRMPDKNPPIAKNSYQLSD